MNKSKRQALLLILYFFMLLTDSFQTEKNHKSRNLEKTKKRTKQNELNVFSDDSVIILKKEPEITKQKLLKKNQTIKHEKLKKLKRKNRKTKIRMMSHRDFKYKLGLMYKDMRKLQIPGMGGGGGSVVVAPSQGSGIANAQVVVNSLGTPAAEPYNNGNVVKGYDKADAEPRVIVTRMKIPTRDTTLI